MRSPVCIEAAHNPAAAGSLVQIQPPQPILFKRRWLIAFTSFRTATENFTSNYPTIWSADGYAVVEFG
jgi:hypothetical protein